MAPKRHEPLDDADKHTMGIRCVFIERVQEGRRDMATLKGNKY